MPTCTVRLFSLFGVAFWLHGLWFPLAPIVAATLALNVFPALVPELAHATYWLMAAAGTVGVLVSVLLREIVQAIVTQLRHLPARNVTLHIFGGEWRIPGRRPRDELLLSASGLTASLGLSAMLLVLLFGTVTAATPLAVAGVMLFVAAFNGGLALFNLLPAYPFGTGNLLRSTLAVRSDNLAKATRIAAIVTIMIGSAAILVGLLAFFGQSAVLGGWLLLIGTLVNWIAGATLRNRSNPTSF
jgi:Zn-dependent protease